MEKLDKFQGHVVLYCKSHYSVKDVDFITGLQRIWAVRCGFDVGSINKSILEYIADDMYRVLQKTNPSKLEYLWQIIHKELSENTFIKQYEDLTSIERLIMVYQNEISMLQVKDSGKVLIELPKPQKQLFKRIVRGNGRFKDYELVK